MDPNNEEDVNHFIQNGLMKTPKLNVRSVKVYADGALGLGQQVLPQDRERATGPGHWRRIPRGPEDPEDFAQAEGPDEQA